MPYTDTGRNSLYHEDAGAGGAPLLLLHELGGSSESWARVIPRLARGRRVIAPDLVGAGRSEKPPGPVSIEDQADAMAALLRACGIGTADVMGGALGSLVAVVLARRHPDLVGRLVLCAVADDMSGRTEAYLADRAARVRREGMRTVVDSSLANAFPEAFEADRAAYRPIWLANDPASYAELSLALARLRLSGSDWAAITAPTLVVSGAHDFIWPPPLGQAVAARIKGARFAVLPDAGHFPHLQTPEALADLADRFLV
jgi:3-oxoadipate enol-lactonase